MWSRLTSWRFWILVLLVVIDATMFVIPAVASGLVVAALVAPELLRRAGRFLQALADTDTA